MSKMIRCDYCGQNTTESDACAFVGIGYKKGLEPISHSGKDRCDYCNVLPGKFHHVGCGNEKCPQCTKSVYYSCLCR